MKSEGQVKQKLKQVFFRHLKKYLAEALRQVPENCTYNRQPLDSHSRVLPELPRMCIHAERAGHICSSNHGGSVDFASCPFFTPLRVKEQVKVDFVRLAKSERSVIAEVMPDAAALLWVLDQETGEDGDDPFEVSQPENLGSLPDSKSESEPEPETETEPQPEPQPEQTYTDLDGRKWLIRRTFDGSATGVWPMDVEATPPEESLETESKPVPRWKFWSRKGV